MSPSGGYIDLRFASRSFSNTLRSISSGFMKLMDLMPICAPSSVAPESTTCFRKPYTYT